VIGRSRCLKLKASSAIPTSDSFCLALADNSLHTLNIKPPAIDEMKLTETAKITSRSTQMTKIMPTKYKKSTRIREILTIERLKRYNDWKLINVHLMAVHACGC
jgi:hypothetical protein